MAKKKVTKPRPSLAESDPWKEQSSTIRQFLERLPRYEKLCAEVAYSLELELDKQKVEVASVSSRAKTLSSFLEKIGRKRYVKPLDDISDLAGVRVVHLYASDFPAIEDILRKQFEVVEKVDKLAEYGEDRFGYGATHFLIRLGDRFAGARYDELKKVICEVQVRTALQDAWAIISHHLVYKRESTIPPLLRRRINSLAGLLETADDQFEHIRNSRNKYIKNLEEYSEDADDFSTEDTNADSLAVYLQRRFPDDPLEGYPGHSQVVLADFDDKRYPTIGDIESLFERTKKASKLCLKQMRVYSFDPTENPATAFAYLAVALSLDDAEYRKSGWDDRDRALFEEFSPQVVPIVADKSK